MAEQRKFTRQERRKTIDALVSIATDRLFYGDARDGPTPALSLEIFLHEMVRYGAIAFRARLRRLSDEQLATEIDASLEYLRDSDERRREYQAVAEQKERLDARAALRNRQAELGHRHGLQKPILEAARHYRAAGRTAKDAWRLIQKQPLQVKGGSWVEIESGKLRHRDRRGKRGRPIKFDQWQKRYWLVAGRGGDDFR
jgi:hypothetical protein